MSIEPHDFGSAAFVTHEAIAPHNVDSDDDNVIESMRMELIVVEIIVKGKMKIIRINDVFHVPNLKSNLFSVTKLLSARLNVQFDQYMHYKMFAWRGDFNDTVRNDYLYKMNYKVYKACAIDLVQSWRKEGAFEL